MNPNVDKIENLLLSSVSSGEPDPRGRLKLNFMFSGFLVIFSFVMMYSRMLQIENLNSYYLYLILALILVISMLAIMNVKRNIRKDNYRKGAYDLKKSYIATPAAILAFVVFLLVRSARQNLSPATLSIIEFIMFTALGLISVFLFSAVGYAVYLMRKYAPYFKDARLRRDSNGTG